MSEWWKTGIIYHIYPRSYQDSNRDGIGDLPGITGRIPHLARLGVNAIWISPIYPSPMADFGYDVSNYRDIHPMFGTLTDMDLLIETAHRHDIRVILDFVPNHTSDQHRWFKESRSSRDNPKRDWYIWRDPAPDGGPPNNWLARFDGKSAWEWDETTEQYYLHTFLKEQPDVNWRNPALREAMLDILRFWFNRGVDGFRVDVAYRVMKDADFTDNPRNDEWQPGDDPSKRVIETYTKNTPDIHMFNRWLREVCDEFDDRVLVGEMNLPIPELVKHYGDGDEFHLPFNFRLIFSDWDAETVKSIADEYEERLPEGGWPNWVLSNHDQPRFNTRAGIEQSRVGLMGLLTLRGTPTLYYGEEIGMENVPIPLDKVQDPWEIGAPGLGRDPERTPMQWDGSPNAGFCDPDVEPWLPVAADYREVNVAVERPDEYSTLSFTKQLITLRASSPGLQLGDYVPLDAPGDLFAYGRAHETGRFLVVLNMGPDPADWQPPDEWRTADPILSTYMDTHEGPDEHGRLRLRGNEGLLLWVN